MSTAAGEGNIPTTQTGGAVSEQMRMCRDRLVAVVAALLFGSAVLVAPVAVPSASASSHRLFDLFDADAAADDWQNTYLLSLLSYYVYTNELDTDDAGFEQAFQDAFEPLGLENIEEEKNVATDVESIVAETDDAIIVTFRGTEFFGPNALDWVDVLIDLGFASDAFGSHSGFKLAASSVANQIRAQLDDAEDKEVWFTGHSLGGATAQMLAYLLRDEYDIRGVVTFGEPHVFKQLTIDWGLYLGHDTLHDRTHLWVNEFDAVPFGIGLADAGVNLLDFSANPFLFLDNLAGLVFSYTFVGNQHHIDVADDGSCAVDAVFPGGIELVNINLDDHDVPRYITRILNEMPASQRDELVDVAMPEGSIVANPPLPALPVADCDDAPNRAPSADAGGPYDVTEGGTVTLAGSGTDPDGDTLTFAWDLDGNGTFESSGASPVFSAAAIDGPATRTVQLRVSDPDGRTAESSATVRVANAAPSVSAPADVETAEGTDIAGSASYSDPAPADTHTATIDWGDGTSSPSAAVTAGTVALAHVYADDGTYTVDVCVTDDDGGRDCDDFEVTVTNADPVVDAGDDQSVDEGDVVSLGAVGFTDAGTADTHTATIDWGDGTEAETGTVSESPSGPPGSSAGASGTVTFGSHVFADDGSYTVEVCVTDDDDGEGCDSLVVTVGNVAATVSIDSVGDGPAFFLPNVSVPLTGSFNDAGSADTHTASVAWGDSTTSAATVSEEPFGPPGSTAGLDGTFTAAHTYSVAGLFTVVVTVTDDDDGSGTATQTVEVLSPADAVDRVIDDVTDAATDPTVAFAARLYLMAALDDLDGTPQQANSGALDKLVDEDWTAALVKIGAALDDLALAEQADPTLDVEVVKLVLAQVAESVAADLVGQAVALLDPPSPGQAKQLAVVTELLAQGRVAIAAGDYRDAVTAFHEATRRAVNLLK